MDGCARLLSSRLAYPGSPPYLLQRPAILDPGSNLPPTPSVEEPGRHPPSRITRRLGMQRAGHSARRRMRSRRRSSGQRMAVGDPTCGALPFGTDARTEPMPGAESPRPTRPVIHRLTPPYLGTAAPGRPRADAPCRFSSRKGVT